MIDEAKTKAASASDSASNTMDKLNDIKTEIDKISLTPVDSNLGNVLDNVDKSGEDLKKLLLAEIIFILVMFWIEGKDSFIHVAFFYTFVICLQ